MIAVMASLAVMLSGGAHPPPAAKPAPKVHTSPPPETEDLKSRPDEPFRLVRKVLQENDQLALVGATADARRREVLSSVGEQMLTAPPEDWKRQRNKIAAVVYVLNGGHQIVFRTLVRHGYLKDLDTSLVEGTLAYSEGRLDEARRLLPPLDPLQFPGTLSSSLFLVKGVLASGVDDGEAMTALDWARLTGTGTLLEESALRRQATTALRMGNVTFSIQYIAKWMRRFPSSSFASDFLERYLLQLVENTSVPPAEIVEAIAARSDELPPGSQCSLLLVLSSAALKKRKLDLVREAAGKAKALAVEGGLEWKRASLYLEAPRAASSQARDALSRLQALDQSWYAPPDQAILAAALSIANQLARAGHDSENPVVEAVSSSDVKDRASRLLLEGLKTLKEAN